MPRRPAQRAEECDDARARGQQRPGDDHSTRELDGHEGRQRSDHEVKEAVVREVVELVVSLLGSARVLEAPREIAETEVLRIVDAGEQARREEPADHEADGGPVEDRQRSGFEREETEPAGLSHGPALASLGAPASSVSGGSDVAVGSVPSRKTSSTTSGSSG